MNQKLLYLFVSLLSLSAITARATVYYVDGSKPNNDSTGTSWGTAKRDVQAAINAATVDGDEVWVKAGTYLPTLDGTGNASPTDPRDKLFYIVNTNIRFYGGFSGTETVAGQRNAATHITILSGDLDPGAGTADAYHVIAIRARTNACQMDGFTITGGRANGSNTATIGGAAINRNTGGGMLNLGNNSALVSNCIFSSNTTAVYGGGGGMYNLNSSPTLSNCIFSANTASGGGGMYNNNSSPTLTNCTFSGNVATTGGPGFSGGGIYNYGTSTPVVSGCIFSANISAGEGGGINSVSGLTLTNCVFSANTAGTTGGGANIIGGLTLNNCVFSGNTAVNLGGALVTNNNVTGRNCTFYNNSVTGATGLGGGLYYTSNGGGTLTNCILWGNTTPNNSNDANREELYKDGTGTGLTVSYSIIRDYRSTVTNNYTAGTGFRIADPRFFNTADPDGSDHIWRTADDGLTLQACSPAIDAGITTNPTIPTDILGSNRSGTYDLGAYEYQGTPTSGIAGSSASATATAGSSYSGGFGSCGAVISDVAASGASPVSGSVTAQVYVQSTAPSANGQPYVRRTYDIRPATNPNTATANITLYFTQGDFDNYNTARGAYPSLPVDAADAANNKANLRVTQQHGTSTTGVPGSYTGWSGTGPANVLLTPTSVFWSAALSRWEVNFPVTGFSGFFVHSGSTTALPLQLLSFSGRVQGRFNELDWKVGDEAPGTSYILERSATGATFEAIGTVLGTGKEDYRYSDEFVPEHAYYRLRSTVADGMIQYSAVVLVRRSVTGEGTVTLAPQPAQNTLVLTNTDAALNGTAALVMDVQGRAIARFTVTSSVSLPVSNWVPGLYTLRLATGEVLRIIKQ